MVFICYLHTYEHFEWGAKGFTQKSCNCPHPKKIFANTITNTNDNCSTFEVWFLLRMRVVSVERTLNWFLFPSAQVKIILSPRAYLRKYSKRFTTTFQHKAGWQYAATKMIIKLTSYKLSKMVLTLHSTTQSITLCLMKIMLSIDCQEVEKFNFSSFQV